MSVVFYETADHQFDRQLYLSVATGCRERGVSVRNAFDCDYRKGTVGVIVGVKGNARGLVSFYSEPGRRFLFLDKGYVRVRGGSLGTLYWRWSANAHQPLHYFRRNSPPDRWNSLNVKIRTRKTRGRYVLVAGSSQKCSLFHGLGGETEYVKNLVRNIKKFTDRPVIYRPKPSWKEAVPVPGTVFSHPKTKFTYELDRAHVVVTFGSNACFDAAVAGVPAVVLGNGITRPISSTSLADIESPRLSTADEVESLCRDVAYCQWSLKEIESGEAWDSVRHMLEV